MTDTLPTSDLLKVPFTALVAAEAEAQAIYDKALADMAGLSAALEAAEVEVQRSREALHAAYARVDLESVKVRALQPTGSWSKPNVEVKLVLVRATANTVWLRRPGVREKPAMARCRKSPTTGGVSWDEVGARRGFWISDTDMQQALASFRTRAIVNTERAP